MDTSFVLGLLMGTVVPSVLVCLLATVLVASSGVRWLRDPGASGLAGLVALCLPVVAASGLASLQGSGAVEGVGTATAYRLVGFFFLVPPVLLLTLFAAIAGARCTQRALPQAGAVLLLVCGTVATTLFGGMQVDDLAFPVVRGIAYGVIGLLVAVAALGAREGPGPASAATVAFALFVASGEVSGRALAQLFLLLGLAGLPEGLAAGFVDVGFETVIDPMRPWHLAVVALGALVGVVGLAGAARASRRSGVAASVALCLLPFAWFAGDASHARLHALAVASATPSYQDATKQ